MVNGFVCCWVIEMFFCVGYVVTITTVMIRCGLSNSCFSAIHSLLGYMI